MFRRTLCATALVAVALATAPMGCGDDGVGKRYPVSGKVTYNGEPLKKGQITFVPEKAEERGGSGVIENGEIKDVTTQSAGDGLMGGKYKVTIVAREDVDTKSVREKYTASPDPVAIAKVENKAKKLIPAKYSNAIDSGLTVDVSASTKPLLFELKD